MTVSEIEGKSNRGIEGEENSWIGFCPWTNDIAYGTESGKVFIPHLFGPNRFVNGKEENLGIEMFSDVINGIAFTDSLVGTSSPSEIVIRERPLSRDKPPAIRHRYDGGAHDILATSNGAFVAPIGSEGLLRLEFSGENQHPRIETLQISDMDWNCYQVCAIQDGKNELFVAASRRTGLATIQFDGVLGQIPIGREFVGIDVVGVVHLPSRKWPRAAVGLGTDGTLIFLRDVLDHSSIPQFIKSIDTRAYSVLSTKGHLFVLSRNALYTFPNLGSQLLDDAVPFFTEVHHIPIRAVDVFLFKDQEIFLETVEGTISFDVETLTGATASHRSFASRPVHNGPAHSPTISRRDHAETHELKRLSIDSHPYDGKRFTRSIVAVA